MNTRKDEHVDLALQQSPTQQSDFDQLNFIHHALAGTNRSQIDLQVDDDRLSWSHPIYINAMTGGTTKTGEINRQLAQVAAQTGVAIACGSMSPVRKDVAAAKTFEVIRENNPDGFLIANVNATFSPAQAQKMVDLISADALQIHINSIQEIVMPEGDRDFSNWGDAIAAIVAHVSVPVIVKEVGFGLSGKTLTQLHKLGVQYADVSGRGGTNFAQIENSRRSRGEYEFMNSWGQSAVRSLLDATTLSADQLPRLLASGGVRSALDVARLLALGALGVGVSGGFLKILMNDGANALADEISSWHNQLKDIMTVLGAKTLAQLQQTDLVISKDLLDYCNLVGVASQSLARRSR